MKVEERGYLEDPYRCEFKAKVLNVEDAGDGKSYVWLDKTFFYPTSGGQPNDLGTIAGNAVLDVLEEGEVVKHITDGVVAIGEEVECAVDWDRRFDHMQQHTGQHLLSRVFVDELSMETIGFHLGRSVSTIDLETKSLSDEGLERVELRANELVWRNVPVENRLMSRDEFEKFCKDQNGAGLEKLRSKLPQDEETVRLVEIKGYDISTCCGTHLRSTGEIGFIKVIGTERIRGNIRVEFLCGGRALSDYMGKHEVLSELSKAFSTDWRNLVRSVEKLLEEDKKMRKANEAASREMARNDALQMASQLEILGKFELSINIIDEADASTLKETAFALREQGDRIVLLGALKPKPFVVFACTPLAPVDMGQIMKEVLKVFEGRGGGGKDYAQGGGILESDVKGVLDKAVELLRKSL